jgi:hypothetical protein
LNYFRIFYFWGLGLGLEKGLGIKKQNKKVEMSFSKLKLLKWYL